MALIKNLMELTYPQRRQSILLQPMAMKELMKEYPALFLTSEVSIIMQKLYFQQTRLD